MSGPAPILLHACCGPCSTHCVRALREAGREPVLFFANDNLDCAAEYEKRLAALRAFADAEGVAAYAAPYDPASWARDTAGLEAEPEGGARCDRCFLHNLTRAAAAAAARGVPFTSSLTVSPHKKSARVFAAGRAAAAASAAAFEAWDFKKKDGFLDSVRLAEAYGLYRQDYCGCAVSKAARTRRAASPSAPP